MSYVKSVLQPGETVVAVGRLHWIGYWPAILCFVAGVIVIGWLYSRDSRNWITSIAWLAFSAAFIFLFVRTWIDRFVTELAVTNNRIIYKYGLIRRHTSEMNMDKVESVNVVQSILGRMLDYGTIDIMGTGQGFESLREFASPLELRNAIIAK
jgi:uncharacterized membrane protein YdbT with pleckstrin-like domain